jgi:hypothetical protein
MERTKLKDLRKKENLSEWQRNKKATFNAVNTFPYINDPWKIKRDEEAIILNLFPALQDFKYGIHPMRNKKDINQILQNKRIDSMKNVFNKFS